jgi:hypothetical protein
VGTVTVDLSVGSEWVDKYGGIGSIKIARQADGGFQEFLFTEFISEDEQGSMTFRAVSPNGFSDFSLLAVAPLASEIVYSGLTIEPQVVMPGEAVEISLIVTNEGSVVQTQSIILEVNGTAEGVQSVTLESGTSTTVVFVVVPERVGSFTIDVAGLKGSLDVGSLLSDDFLNVTDLEITPGEVEPGEPVTITVSATNGHTQRGKFDISLKINNALMAIQPTLLGAGARKTVTFIYVPEVDGRYTVDVHGLSGRFVSQTPPTPADITFAQLRVNPNEVQPNEAVDVTVILVNAGESRGAVEVVIKVNGEIDQVQKVEIEGLSTTPVKFQVKRSEPGVYGVEVEELSDFFRVLAPVPSGLTVTLRVDKGTDSITGGDAVAEGVYVAMVGVSNLDEFSVTETIQLFVDGTIWDSKEVTLGGGESKEITFQIHLEVGEHVISVKGISVTVVVSAGTNWAMVVAAVLIIGGIIAGVGVLALRRRSSQGTDGDGEEPEADGDGEEPEADGDDQGARRRE